MTNSTTLLVSAQSSFAIDNLWSGEDISLTPSIYTMRSGPGGPEYLLIDSWDKDATGGTQSTAVFENEYGARVPYMQAPLILTMKDSTTDYIFNISWHGNNRIAYTPLTAAGVVYPRPFFYDDIIAGVSLSLYTPPRSQEPSRSKLKKVDDTYYLMEQEYRSRGSLPPKRSNYKLINDTELLAFLQNVNIYFSRPIYRFLGSQPVKTDRLELGTATGMFGGRYALTDDINNLYPAGLSTLEIRDGFSHGIATLEFNHNMVNHTVMISIVRHTSKICDIRDLTEHDFPEFPTTICFAL